MKYINKSLMEKSLMTSKIVLGAIVAIAFLAGTITTGTMANAAKPNTDGDGVIGGIIHEIVDLLNHATYGLEATYNAITSVQTDITMIKSDVGDIKTETDKITSINADVTGIKTQTDKIPMVKTDIGTLTSDVGDLQSDITTIKTDIENIENQLSRTSLSSQVIISIQESGVPGCEENSSCVSPFEVRVAVGGEVTWNNDSAVSHFLQSGTPSSGSSGEFDSGLISSGNSFAHTFNQAGVFPYFDLVHPWTQGVVVVGELPFFDSSGKSNKHFNQIITTSVFEGTSSFAAFDVTSSDSFVLRVCASENFPGEGTPDTLTIVVTEPSSSTVFTGTFEKDKGVCAEIGFEGGDISRLSASRENGGNILLYISLQTTDSATASITPF